jgi:glutathione S-transferase
MICAHELELTDRLELVRSVAAMLKPNERLMLDNPLSKIPTLVLDDGFAIFDSVVICEYLDTLGSGSLFPKQGSDKWQALRWHAFGDGLLDALILWRNERERQAPLEALIAAFDLKARASLRQLDDEAQALNETALSIGHIAIACALGISRRSTPLDGAPGTSLGRVVRRNRSRGSFRNTEPVDG